MLSDVNRDGILLRGKLPVAKHIPGILANAVRWALPVAHTVKKY